MLKKLPKIDEVILLLEKQDIYALAPREIVKETCRMVVQNLRGKIVDARKKGLAEFSSDAATVAREVEKLIRGLYRYNLRRACQCHRCYPAYQSWPRSSLPGSTAKNFGGGQRLFQFGI